MAQPHRTWQRRRDSRPRQPTHAGRPLPGARGQPGCARPQPSWQRAGGMLGTNRQPNGSSAVVRRRPPA
eukprot:6416785-Alexandrium_andersonii.AAC.1